MAEGAPDRRRGAGACTTGWLETRACAGFGVMFHIAPEGLDDVADRPVPELRRRGRSD